MTAFDGSALSLVQREWLGQKAADRNVSMSEMLRRCVDSYFLSHPDVSDELVQAEMAVYVKRRYQV